MTGVLGNHAFAHRYNQNTTTLAELHRRQFTLISPNCLRLIAKCCQSVSFARKLSSYYFVEFNLCARPNSMVSSVFSVSLTRRTQNFTSVYPFSCSLSCILFHPSCVTLFLLHSHSISVLISLQIIPVSHSMVLSYVTVSTSSFTSVCSLSASFPSFSLPLLTCGLLQFLVFAYKV